jgi:hypothetical protein
MSAPSVEKCGDMPLTEVTRAKASDFLSGLDVSTQTRNTYALTLKRVFKCAARRGRACSPCIRHLSGRGLLEYIANLPRHGQLFLGLKRRASKDAKIGARVGEIFNKKRRTLGIKRKGMKLDFHSFRHTVANVLDIAGVQQSDAARVLGHAVAGMSYGQYSQGGPGLIRVKDVVEKIAYDGLRL